MLCSTSSALKVATLGLLLSLWNTAFAGGIPARAYQYLPQLKVEIDNNWPNTPMREYFGGLIDHESGCPGMRSKCWSPTSRFKTRREEGGGMGMLTRAYRANGTLRFDALAEMRDRHPALRELQWSNLYQRADLQLRAVVLKVRSDFAALSAVADRKERLRFADAAYNGGLGGVRTERRACGMKRGCDPQKWDDHVELIRIKSQKILYGNRSAWDINRHHVKDVIDVRAPRYKGLL